ncbi:hypothetical protein TCEL_02214 [Thermobrachium celere DSM 8682]|uniref:Uncharacterized protein n=1 Tax=Thermobrachium celere DSM 8682 TaxID=941824 RepID=R7RUG8_9CLOT|nr:hypothetical protein TCEL_02214 [Thermobrachium celere DSM 8682]
MKLCTIKKSKVFALLIFPKKTPSIPIKLLQNKINLLKKGRVN